ncbi:phage tail protein [Roseospira navarrensis]|uniref:Phage tail protein n=1 Tax=Roseospira navarrensis TaxID=140058 RepID=A0A7X2D1V9_9PROT|nr:tail fiber protein [Roseospira navarrensis]MQX35604.1 phage tail protein [Roseospira navarrensis]
MTLRKPLTLAVAGAAVGLAAVALTPRAAQACSSDPFIGSICFTAATFCPDGVYLSATGGMVQISQFQALFSLLGTTYGGNGTTTFQLPDLRGRSMIGAGTAPGLNPVRLGDKRGVETVPLDVSTMPTHTHPIADSGSGTGQGTIDVVPGGPASGSVTEPVAGTGYFLGGMAGRNLEGPYTPATPGSNPAQVGGVTLDTSELQAGPAGGGQPHYNIPPQLALTPCIAHDGIYPPRP